jgi:hypothetical protein
MKTSVEITTPFPTTDEVADILGIGKKRRKQIAVIARSGLAHYDARQERLRTVGKRSNNVALRKKQAA